jgi:hypothetical protein
MVAERELVGSRADVAAALDAAPSAVSYPFGASGAREHALARDAGYDVAFTLNATWTGDAMAIPRLPVYMWSPPLPGVGLFAALERVAATGANKAAVGTSVWQSLFGRDGMAKTSDVRIEN